MVTQQQDVNSGCIRLRSAAAFEFAQRYVFGFVRNGMGWGGGNFAGKIPPAPGC